MKKKHPEKPRSDKPSGKAQAQPSESANEWERKQTPVPSEQGGRTAEQQPQPPTHIRHGSAHKDR